MKVGNRIIETASLTAWCIGLAGTFLLVGWLAWLVAERTRPAGVDVARAGLRRTNLVELMAENRAALTSYGWIDQNKGIVRLPVERALELSLQLGLDPAAARSNLVGRLEKATAKPPEQPNPYE